MSRSSILRLTYLTVILSGTIGALVWGEGPKPAPAGKLPRTDRYGDPLPPGAVARLGTTRLRHAGPINCVAFAADGKTIWSAGRDEEEWQGWLHQWDAATGKRLHSVRLSNGWVPRCFSPGARQLALVWEGHVGKVRLLATAPGQRAVELHARVKLSDMMFAAGGKLFVALDLDPPDQPVRNVWRVWEAETGREFGTWSSYDRHGINYVMAPDGVTLAGLSFTNSKGDRTHLCDPATGARIRRLPVIHQEFFFPFGILGADGKTLFRGMHVWDLATNRVLQQFADERVRGLGVVSPDGQSGVTCDPEKRQVFLWDTARAKLRAKLEDLALSARPAFSPDGSTLATADESYRIRLWDVATGNEKCAVDEHRVPLSSVAVSADGRTLATLGSEGTVCLWALPPAAQPRRLPVDKKAVTCVAFAPRGRLLVTGGSDGTVRFWDPDTGKEQRQLRAEGKAHESTAAVVFSPDGSILATVTTIHEPHTVMTQDRAESLTQMDYQRLRLWDVQTGKLLPAQVDQQDWIGAIAFSPDGKTVVAGGVFASAPHTCVWDVKSGKLLRQFKGGDAGSQAHALAFSPDGKVLCTAGGDSSKIAFVELASGKPLAQFDGVPNQILDGVQTCVQLATGKRLHQFGYFKSFDPFLASALSPDGRTFAVGSWRGISLWDMVARRQLRRIQGDFDACQGLAFAPDGRTLITAHADGTALFWDLTDPALGKAP